MGAWDTIKNTTNSWLTNKYPGAWDAQTPQTDYLTDYTKQRTAEIAANKNKPVPAADNPFDEEWKRTMAAIEKAMAASNAYRPTPMKTLKQYDPTAWMQEAQTQAANDINPYYSGKLNDYLKSVELRKTRQNEDTTTANENYDLQGKYIGEDLATMLGDISSTRREQGAQEAMGATQNRSANQAGLANAGLTFSGIGQEKLNLADTARRLALTAYERGLTGQEAGAKTTAERGKTQIAQGKTQTQKTLARFMEDIVTEEKGKREDIDFERQQKILEAADAAVTRRGSEYTANPNNYDTVWV